MKSFASTSSMGAAMELTKGWVEETAGMGVRLRTTFY
jgi:hypothetical protein